MATKSKTPSTRRNQNKTSNIPTSGQAVENATKIIRTALKRKTSVSSASVECGKGRNYVSNVYAKLENNRRNKNITNEHYSAFKSAYNEYKKNYLQA